MDNVNHPSHYTEQCSMECIEVMELFLNREMMLGFCMGNCFKYLWRWKGKNGAEDLDKASWYANRAYKYTSSEAEDEKIGLLDELIGKARDKAWLNQETT